METALTSDEKYAVAVFGAWLESDLKKRTPSATERDMLLTWKLLCETLEENSRLNMELLAHQKRNPSTDASS